MIILAGLHIFDRLGYFKRIMATARKGSGPLKMSALIGIAVSTALLLLASLLNWQPASVVMEQSYEARQSANIVRSSPLTGFEDFSKTSRLIARKPPEDADFFVSVFVGLKEAAGPPASVVVWAETTNGAMIETLYLDESLAYSDRPIWNSKETSRNDIFPIWRNRYTLVSGIDPNGTVGAETGTTPTHSFSLNDYISAAGASTFVIFAEVNQSGDTNRAYDDPHIGQPSLLYSALIKPGQGSTYSIMKLTAHGGGAQKSGALQYDMDKITTAKDLVDILLLDVRVLKPDAK